MVSQPNRLFQDWTFVKYWWDRVFMWLKPIHLYYIMCIYVLINIFISTLQKLSLIHFCITRHTWYIIPKRCSFWKWEFFISPVLWKNWNFIKLLLQSLLAEFIEFNFMCEISSDNFHNFIGDREFVSILHTKSFNFGVTMIYFSSVFEIFWHSIL